MLVAVLTAQAILAVRAVLASGRGRGGGGKGGGGGRRRRFGGAAGLRARWASLSVFDRTLACLVGLALLTELVPWARGRVAASGGGGVAQGGGGGGGSGGIRGGSAPGPGSAPDAALAPTPAEDPAEVAASLLRSAPAPPPEVAACDRQDGDWLSRVRASGMRGDQCRGQPFTQACSFTQLTRHIASQGLHSRTWLGGYAEEVGAVRAGGSSSQPPEGRTFVGIGLGSPDAAAAVVGRMGGGPGSGTSGPGPGEGLRSRPLLLTNVPSPGPSPITKGWGLVGGDAAVWIAGVRSPHPGQSTLDDFAEDRGVRDEIKDVVLIEMAGDSVLALEGGWATMARTRYVEFAYDWKDAWGEPARGLRPVVQKMHGLGHTCYWAGDGKLWRLTECWQDFYSYKSYAFLACANRHLAPKLSEEMERTFRETIGVSTNRK